MFRIELCNENYKIEKFVKPEENSHSTKLQKLRKLRKKEMKSGL